MVPKLGNTADTAVLPTFGTVTINRNPQEVRVTSGEKSSTKIMYIVM